MVFSRALVPSLLFSIIGLAAACGSSDRDPVSANADGGAGNGVGNGQPGFGGPGTEPSDATPPAVGTLTGKVVMPEGTIPVSDALVYLTSQVPEPIPTGAYCDKCVALSSYAFTYSKPDGTFELPAYATGDQYLVVQKGQFRRYRTITVVPGPQVVPDGRTRLPGKNNAQLGDTVPRMLIWPGSWDHVERSLKKIGLEEFDKFEPGFDFNAPAAKMKEFPNYHMIFLPCSGTVKLGESPQCGVLVDDGLMNASKDFVAKGGKLYVTDWSYEYVRQGWKGALTWEGESAQIGSACQGGGGEAAASWDDPSLKNWMVAIGEGSASVKGAWTTLKSANPVPVVDENGATKTEAPKVWVSSGGRPTTVSFQDRCGRVLYSTYHTEGSDSSIGGTGEFLAQEKALMHILLEVGVCVGPKPQPPPK
ncbi:MAG: hypothetical protein IPG50_20470 [Myxococcales bacterium]|nr:hypothetical protein [Myxococcales bacterium]